MSSNVSTAERPGLLTLTTSRVVTAAVLVALTIIMGVVPGVGFIPVPTPTGAATIEHVPTILGSVLEGPGVGMVTGLTFGLLSFTRATIPLFKDPLVAIVPRILIGLTPWLVFTALKRVQLDLAAGAAGLVGAATNTFFVLFFAVWRGYLPMAAIPAILVTSSIWEAILAIILTIIVTRAVYITRNRITHARDKKDRSKMAY